jgi:hypothetical protein
LTSERPRFFDDVLDHYSDDEQRRIQMMFHSGVKSFLIKQKLATRLISARIKRRWM